MQQFVMDNMIYILVILFTLSVAYYDAQELKEGRYFKDHTPRAAFRLLILAILSFLFNIHILISLSIFYIIFDYSLNLMRNLKWNYIGTVAITDQIWNKVGGWIPQLIFKIVFLITTLKYL